MYNREENESDSQYFDRIFESIEPFTDALVTGVSVIDITETDDRYIVRIRVSSMISCRRPKFIMCEFLKSALTTEQQLRLKDEHIRLLTTRTEQAEFDSLCYKLLYSSDDERVDLILMDETLETVTFDVRHNDTKYHFPNAGTHHLFHKSCLTSQQLHTLETLELKCKQRALMVGEMRVGMIDDYIHRLVEDIETGNVSLMERMEDNESVWIYIYVKNQKTTRITSLSKHFHKNTLTKAQLQAFRSIPLSKNENANARTRGEL